MSELIQRVAPNLALRVTGTAGVNISAGLDAPEYPTDNAGTPLPYIQEQGREREYFDGSGQGPITGLRGRMPMQEANPAPNAGIIPPEGFGGAAGNAMNQRVIMGIPAVAGQSQPPMGNSAYGRTNDAGAYGYTRPGQGFQTVPREVPRHQLHSAPRDMLRQDTGPRAIVPRVDRVMRGEDNIAVQQNNGEQTRIDENSPLHGIYQPGDTLGQLLERFNFRIPQRERRNDGLRGRDEITAPARQGTVTRTSQSFAPPPRFNTPEGMAEFNRLMGVELGTQVRTQAEQDALYNRGLTPTRRSAHIAGRALDWPGSQLNGLTGTAAEDHVRNRFIAVYGPDVANSYSYRWESGKGRNQGTGPHVHIQRTR